MDFALENIIIEENYCDSTLALFLFNSSKKQQSTTTASIIGGTTIVILAALFISGKNIQRKDLNKKSP